MLKRVYELFFHPKAWADYARKNAALSPEEESLLSPCPLTFF